MSEIWDVMKWPLATCLLLPPLLVYLGLHVVQRGVIFVDLALAQVATLGACLALFIGHLTGNAIDLHDPITFWISLAVTLIAAALFSVSRGSVKRQVPQEAIIGIAFVVAAAGGIALLSQVEGGSEEVQNLLVGEILTVTREEVFRRVALFGALAIFYAAFHKKFELISFDPQKAEASGLRIRMWDFLFYAVFGLVVVSFVRVAGVLLTFSYLIVPAVCGVLLARTLMMRLLMGWGISVGASLVGLWASYQLDLPTGAAIVCALGFVLGMVSIAIVARRR